MDYKEKYNAALERAKAFELPEYKNIMASVFPELKESENERIRDSLINFLKSPFVHENITDEKVAPWITWLEKQKITTDKEYVFRPLAGDTIEKAAEKAVELGGKVVLAFNGAYIPVGIKTKDEIVAEYHNWVKKQGEQTTNK